MWRLSVVILALGAAVQCAPTGDENTLLQRARRSHYCPPGPPGPLGPPPSPPSPPSPPQSYFRQQQSYSQASAQAGTGQLERFTQDRGQNNQQQNNQRQNYQEQNHQGQNKQGQNIPCDTCKGQNSAISNAKSETGNAVAISVSKG